MAARKRGLGGEAERKAAATRNGRTLQSRREHKAIVEARQRKLDRVRWVLVALVIVLLGAGLYYYYIINLSPQSSGSDDSHTVSQPGTQGKEGERTGEGGGMEDTKNKKKTKKDASTAQVVGKNTKKGSKSKKRNSDGTTTSKTNKQTNQGRAKPKSNKDISSIEMNDLRLLRRPIPPQDSDRPYIIEILNGDNLLLEKRFSEALEKFNEILKMFPQSPRGLFGKGETLYGLAREKSSNKLRDTAIEFYEEVSESLLTPHAIKLAALARMADLNQERGRYAAAVKALEKLYRLDSNDSVVANRLGVGYISAGNPQKAEDHFRQVVSKSPDNVYAKAHLGYVLFQDRRYEEALPLLMEGLRRDEGIRKNGRFYLYAGETLTRLKRYDEAHVLYSEAVSLGLFPSLYQRSLFNEPDLRDSPWWALEETGYQEPVQQVLNSIPNITDEVIPMLLGESQMPRTFSLFTYGKKNAENCRKVPHTCSLFDHFPEATGCKRGEIKIIVVPPGAHVVPQTSSTNTRLEIVLGLQLEGEGLRLRVAEETRVLPENGVLAYDDSFEHELWYTGLGPGLVLSMDVWHPDLTLEQQRKLHPIH